MTGNAPNDHVQMQDAHGDDDKVVWEKVPILSYAPTIGEYLEPLVDSTMHAIILGRSKRDHERYQHTGLIDLGMICEHQSEGEDYHGYRVLLDAEFPHVIFICGKRGSGKSYTLGVIAEELARARIGIGTVVVDPIGIFWAMKLKNQSQREVEELSAWGLTPQQFDNVNILTPIGFYEELQDTVDGPFSIGVSDLTPEDWCLVFGIDRFKAQGLLIGDAIEKIKRGYRGTFNGKTINVPARRRNYSIGDIIQCIEHDIDITSKESGYAQATRRSIVARFKASARWGIFSTEGTPIHKISRRDEVTVIDVSHPKLEDDMRALIVGILARKILEARIGMARHEEAVKLGVDVTAKPRSYGVGVPRGRSIPVTWLVVDEVHMLIPHVVKTSASEALIEYAKLGRKPGCALVLATQRPAATSDEILSQVDTIIAHTLALEDDIAALRRRIPAKLPGTIADSDFIRGLPAGVGLVADQHTQQRSMLIRVRPRLTHHGGREATPVRKLQEPVGLVRAGTRALIKPKHLYDISSAVLKPVVDVTERLRRAIPAEVPSKLALEEGIREEVPQETPEVQAEAEELPKVQVPTGTQKLLVVGTTLNMESIKPLVDRKLKRTLFGKLIETVSNIEQVYLPLWCIHVKTLSGKIFTKEREGVIYWDPVVGEMITAYRKGLKRTRGLHRLYRLQLVEVRILRVLKPGKSMTLAELMDQLQDLSERELQVGLKVLKRERLATVSAKTEDGEETYVRNIDLSVPAKIDRCKVELPSLSETRKLAGNVLETKYGWENIEAMITTLSPRTRVVGKEQIYYPYFEVTTSGKKGRKLRMFCGATGYEDKVLADAITYENY